MGSRGETAKDARGPAVVDIAASGRDRGSAKGHDLLPVLPHNHQAGEEGTDDLGEDIIRNLASRKALPEPQAECDGGIEVATRGRAEDDDGEGDTESLPSTR